MAPMARPVVLIAAAPHVYATALACTLRQRGDYDVHVPKVSEGHDLPGIAFDVVLTNLPVPRRCGRVILELPEAGDDAAVVVKTGDVVIRSRISWDTFVTDVLALVEEFGGAQASGRPPER